LTINTIATAPVTTGLTVPASVDYTSKDFLGFMSALQTYVNTAMPQWQIGQSEGDIGLAIIEAFAYEGDILSYYGDRISQEAYLPTATQRQSLLNIAQLLGYTVSNGAPATGTVTLQTFANGPAVQIPPLTQLMTGFNATLDSTVIYEVNPTGQPVSQTTVNGVTGFTVPANAGTLTLNVTQGYTVTAYTVGTSNGNQGQAFSLPQAGVLDGTVAVSVQQPGGTPVAWSYVQFLGDYGAGAAVYTTYLDSTGLTWIQFGDNVNGAVPVSGATILATYRVGAGSAGNVSAGSVGTFLSPIQNVQTQVTSGAYVSSAMTGGMDPESNDQIRTNAPASFATVQRAVSLSDFIAIAQNVVGVTAATAVAAHSTSVTIYAMGNNNQPASTALQGSIVSAFSGNTLAGVTVTTAQPTLVAMNATISLNVANTYSVAQVTASVQSALNAMFSNPNTYFGQLVTVGAVYGTILAVPGVAYAVVSIISRNDVTQTNTNPIQLRAFEIAVPGTWTITATGGV
jgi:hypothetical protein